MPKSRIERFHRVRSWSLRSPAPPAATNGLNVKEINQIRIGCAGWAIPKERSDLFPTEGTHLGRYAAVFPAVEINSSFFKPHRPTTYVRWAESVPPGFKFSVKMPKTVTHERRLKDTTDILDNFLAEATQLGDRMGPLLVQLPPSLPFSADIAGQFFGELRDRFEGDGAFEPRHVSWFEPRADPILIRHRVARVVADPAVVQAAGKPGGYDGLVYYSLHGSPRVYYSSYADDRLETLAKELGVAAQSATVWCVFDNTAASAATLNALDVLDRVGAG
jgi:uncharacterized protein YecE (DUF72 family)